jgi:WbqC-like protein family
VEGNFEQKERRIVAIHQPNYLPWPGYFYKIFASDVFVFHDNVEHSKRYPTRRTCIRAGEHSDTANWLTVPLRKSSDFSPIKDLLIDHRQPWQNFHLRKLRQTYRHAPFFDRYFPLLEEWLESNLSCDYLADLNIELVLRLSGILGIRNTFCRSSDLPVAGKGGEYNIALVKHLGGTAYLSGMGGKNYMRMDEFASGDIEMRFTGFGDWLSQNPYPQTQGTKPLGGLSVMDALFNIGAEGVLEIFENYLKIRMGKKTQ